MNKTNRIIIEDNCELSLGSEPTKLEQDAYDEAVLEMQNVGYRGDEIESLIGKDPIEYAERKAFARKTAEEVLRDWQQGGKTCATI